MEDTPSSRTTQVPASTPAPKAVEHPPGLFWSPQGISLDKRILSETAVNNVVAFFSRNVEPENTAQ
jgi:hypothetical protein